MSESRTRRGTVSLPGRGPSGSVVDELRAVPMVPATTTTPAVTTPAAAPPAVPAAPAAATPPPPPRKHRQAREQFSTKLPPQLIQDMRGFAEHHEAEIQVVVELALTEYLASRGWKTGT